MRVGIETLRSRTQTGKAIYKAARYWKDLGTLLDTTLEDFYSFVRKIRYVEDTKDEVVSRPKYILTSDYGFKGIDCKKKAVLLMSWLLAHGYKPGKTVRLVAVSERPDKKIHHVFIQCKIDGPRGKWKNIDATYKDYRLFQAKPEVTDGEELLP